MKVDLGPLFDTQDPLISLKEIVAMNQEQTAPLWFAFRDGFGQRPVEVGPGLTTPITSTDTMAIKLVLAPAAGRIMPAMGSAIPDIYVPVSYLSRGDKLMAWFGQTWTPPVSVSVGGY